MQADAVILINDTVVRVIDYPMVIRYKHVSYRFNWKNSYVLNRNNAFAAASRMVFA